MISDKKMEVAMAVVLLSLYAYILTIFILLFTAAPV